MLKAEDGLIPGLETHHQLRAAVGQLDSDSQWGADNDTMTPLPVWSNSHCTHR